MKTKTYRHRKTTCRGYYRQVGYGWEVGFKFGSKTLFVGNFIHSREATEWWNLMNHEITTFARKYRVYPNYPTTHYTHFLTTHLYNRYYNWLDRLFTKYRYNYRRAELRDRKTWQWKHRGTGTQDRVQLLRAA